MGKVPFFRKGGNAYGTDACSALIVLQVSGIFFHKALFSHNLIEVFSPSFPFPLFGNLINQWMSL